MIPIYQTRNAGPDSPGNCFAACIASILQYDLDEIPDWFDGLHNGQEVTSYRLTQMREWFQMLGLYYFEFSFRMTLFEVTSAMSKQHPGVHYIVIGQLENGLTHAVVCRDGVIVHNPGVTRNPRLAPLDDGHIRIGIIGKNV